MQPAESVKPSEDSMPPPTSVSILIVDDEELIRWSLSKRMEAEGHRAVSVATGDAAVEAFESDTFDLVFLDYRLPDCNGLQVLQRLKDIDPDVPVILLTAFSTVRRAVDAMQIGAFHFMSKPFDVDEVAVVAERALETTRLRREVRWLRGRETDDGIIGRSKAVRELRRMLHKFAQSPASTVLVIGESGTGKDLAARAVHRGSPRRDGPFMNITCSALSESLLESELFGHERGAFTDARTQKKGLLEAARGGTVFLDEIGEMTPSLQAKLLRFMEDQTFRRVGGTAEIRPDVRIVAATHRDLEGMVDDGSFRQDLYYRLSVLQIRTPPLRERGDDIRLLAYHFIDHFARELNREVNEVSPKALELFLSYDWPGNVRELRNVMERAVLLAEHPVLEVDDFPQIATRASRLPPPPTVAAGIVLPPEGVNLDEVEKELVFQALQRSKGSRTGAGRLLGINRDQVRYRIDKFDLKPLLGETD